MKTQKNQTIAILPLGAWEQHGPHLPLRTDSIIVSNIISRLASVVFSSPIHILPTEEIGYSVEHMDFKGSKTLSYHEAIERWLGIIEEQYNNGICKVLLLNAHGGNSPLLTIVATEARTRWNILVVVTHWMRFGLPDEIDLKIDKSIDIHAGEIETSLILSISPDSVNRKAVQHFPSQQVDYIRKFNYLRAYGSHTFGWKMSDLNEQGAVGHADRATAETGDIILQHVVYGLTLLIEDMIKFDVAKMK